MIIGILIFSSYCVQPGWENNPGRTHHVFLSWIAIGDCSIEAAKKNDSITKVNTLDWDAKNILGISIAA